MFEGKCGSIVCVWGGGGGGGVEEAKDTPEDQIVHFTSLQ